MMPLAVATNTQILGWTLLATLGATAAVALIVAAFSRLLPGSATARYRIALAGVLVSGVIAACTFAALRVGVPISSVVIWRASNADAWSFLLPMIAGAWFIGVIFHFIACLIGMLRLRRMILGSCACDSLRPIAEALFDRAGLRAELRATDEPRLTTPAVVGWIRPRILVPTSVAETVSAENMRHLLAHEIAHVAHRDFAVNCALSLIELLLWFSPAAWWISRRVRIERECRADDYAVRLCEEPPIRYARTLLALGERRPPRFAHASGGGELSLRIGRLIGDVRFGARRGAIGGLVIAISGLIGVVATTPLLISLRSSEMPGHIADSGDARAAAPGNSTIDLAQFATVTRRSADSAGCE